MSSSSPPTDPGMSPREKTLVAMGVVAVLTFVVFGAALSHDFVTWDDNLHTYENPWFTPITLAHIMHFWRHSYADLYIPVSYTLFGLLALIASGSRTDPAVTDTGALLDPRVFHAADVALHLASALIVFAILRRLVRSDIPAACGALLFAVHPLQVESVAWIAETRGVLAGLFCLWAVAIYVARIERLRDENRRLLDWQSWSVLVLLALLALLSKPSAVMLPFLLFALAVGLRLRSTRDAAVDALPLLAAAMPIVLLTRSVQHPAAFSITPILMRPFVAGDALAFYLAKLLAPLGLVPDYSRTPTIVLAHWWGYVTWLVPVAAIAIAYHFRQSAPYLLAGLAVFGAALLPVLGLIPFGYQAFSTVADRYAYLAMLGPATIVAYALTAQPSKGAYAVTGIVLIVLSGLTMRQTSHWANSTTLYTYAVAVNPNSSPMQLNAGALIMKDNPAGAEPYFRAAIRANRLFPNEHINLGSVLTAMGRYNEALEQFFIAYHLDRRDASIPYDIGNTLMEMGRYTEAAAAYGDALKLKPQHVGAIFNLARAYMHLGQYSEAAAQFDRAIALRPTEVGFYVNAALALSHAGRRVDAVARLQSALAIDPANQSAKDTLAQIQR